MDYTIQRTVPDTIAAQGRPTARKGIPFGNVIRCTQQDAIVVNIAEPPTHV